MIGKRLREFADTVYGSVARFAEATGWDPGSFYKYFNGRQEPGKDLLRRVAELGCNVTWLITGDGSMFADTTRGDELRESIGYIATPSPGRSVTRVGRIPLFMTAISAGTGQPGDDTVRDYIDVGHMALPQPKNFFACIVTGDSMAGMGIVTGDYIVAERSETAENGDLIACTVNGELMLRIYRVFGEAQFLFPNGVGYQPLEIVPEITVQVWGIVRWMFRDLRNPTLSVRKPFLIPQ